MYHNKFMLELYFKCKNDQDENTNKSHYDELEIEDDLLSKRLRNNTVEDDQPSWWRYMISWYLKSINIQCVHLIS